MQWLPYKWHYQIFYLIYRWVVALYFNGWLISSGIISDKFFIYLTNWAFVLFNTHLLYAALSTTADYCKAYLCCRQHYNELVFERDADEFEIIQPEGCFNREHNQLQWYHMIQWVLFTLSIQVAATVVILYWGLLYRGGFVDVYDAHYHLANGIIGLIDMWVSGLPIRFLHFYMPQLFAAAYISFTGIYYAAGGTGYNDTSYIYPPLNYEEHPGSAAALCLGVFVCLPILHFFFFGQYVARYWLVYLIYGRQRRPHVSRVPQFDEELETNPASNIVMTD